MLKTAVILAGGFGTRLQVIVSGVPKPMAPVDGRPFLDYQLNYLIYYGFQNVVFSVGYLAEKIIGHYGSVYKGLNILYVTEHAPLGTGGGIRLALSQCSEEAALVLNGDSFFDLDPKIFYELHTGHDASVSIALRSVHDASRYGTIETNKEGTVTSFREKSGGAHPGLINAGVYILNKNFYLNSTPPQTSFSIEKDFFEKQLHHTDIRGFEFQGYFIDIGVPNDYTKAQHDFKGFKYR